MSAPDFAAIIAAAALTGDALDHAGHAVLAAEVPELCPTCGGRGWEVCSVNKYGEPDGAAECLDCPTIAKLLAIGAAVMSADMDDQSTMVRLFLDHLRAVQP